MSQDTAPRHRYAVTFEVIIYVEAETDDKAIDAAEEMLDAGGYIGTIHTHSICVTLEDVGRVGA